MSGSRPRGVGSVTFAPVSRPPAILPASALALQAAGAQPLRGALADLDVLRAGAAQADGVIYLAFGTDYSSADSLARSVTKESAALAALGEQLIGSDRPFVTVSGTPGCRAAPPPKPTRYRPTGRLAAEAAPATRSSSWPRAGYLPWPCAYRARSTIRARPASLAC